VFVVTVALGATTVSGCTKHNVAAVHPCPVVATKKVVTVANRGAIAMAKVGLTPKELKAVTTCP
jgi:hypothetical protein